MLLCKLPYLRQWTEARRRAARLYKDKLKDLPVKIAKTADNTGPAVFHLFVVSLDDRDRIIEGLRNTGHGSNLLSVGYSFTTLLQFSGYKRGDFPAAEHNAAHCLSLPIYPEIR